MNLFFPLFWLLQVNASECRSGALIKHKFSQAIGSHGLSKRFAIYTYINRAQYCLHILGSIQSFVLSLAFLYRILCQE